MAVFCISPGWALRATSYAVPHHDAELGFGDGERVRCQSSWSAGDWWAWCSLDEVDLALETRWANKDWKFGEDVHRSNATDDFDVGICELAVWAGADNDVTPSSRRLLLQSIQRPKRENRHVKSRCNPRLRLSGSHP
jgi:hypothetical protein